MLTVIRRRGSLLTKTALTCAAASGCVETACACCTIHSSHFAVTDGDLVGIGFVAVRQKANYLSRYNLLQEVYINMQNQNRSQAATGDAVETDPNIKDHWNHGVEMVF